MKRLVYTLLLLTILQFSRHSLFATIRLPSAVGNNMVLQQKTRVKLWGWGDPGEGLKVRTDWSSAEDSTIVNSDGKWILLLSTPAAGGPFTITLQGWNTLVLKNVMIGEVWVCSGQSNMEWSSYNNNRQIIDEIPNSNNNNLRLFHIPRTSAENPQENCEGSWQVSSPETVKGFSAIGYFFGKKLQEELKVPVGLIMNPWGGTPVESWTPADVINNNKTMQEAAAKLAPVPWGPTRPGLLYNGMVAPIGNYEIAGVIWYQGESNTGNADTYSTTFTNMIKSWRELWKKNFPFYYVQIAPYAYGNHHVGAIVREQQTLSLKTDNTGMVVITDLVDDINNIHPANKRDVADRLCNMALAKTYKKPVSSFQSPLFNHMEIKKNEVTLFFDYADNGFIVNGKKPEGFYIAGGDKVFLPADVKIIQNKIVLKNKDVKSPVAVRFGFSNTAMPNVFSKGKLPLNPFRTDNWELDTSAIKKQE